MAKRRLLPIAGLLLFGFTAGTGVARGPVQNSAASPKASGTADPAPTGPFISALPPVIYVGDNFAVIGSGFTPGSVINLFVATSVGAANFGPLDPGAFLPDTLLVFVPTFVSQGEGVASVEVVNTDESHIISNVVLALLQGDPAAGLPSLTAINGVGLSATSTDPGVAVANVETVVAPGSNVTLTGSGFDIANGVGVDLFCDCPGGKVGPFFLNPGNPGLSSTQLTFPLPSGSSGPSTGPGAFVVTNIGNFLASAAVSVPIGAQISVSGIEQTGSTVTISGAGFSTFSVINFFNLQGGAVVNLGGLNSDGTPKIPLTLVNARSLTFNLPAGAVAGAAYVQVLNPPFIPFSSTGNSPAGAFELR